MQISGNATVGVRLFIMGKGLSFPMDDSPRRNIIPRGYRDHWVRLTAPSTDFENILTEHVISAKHV